MFSLKLTARPDARMVEVPLEIEAELPREFEGAAVLASSGLPRRVRIKVPKDAVKISTAYRADQLVGDIVRTALRGTSSDVHRAQEAVMKFVRAVRERRQDGATLLVSSNGRGKIDVVEVMGSVRPQPPPEPVQPFEPPQSRSQPPPAPAPDRIALLEKRLGDLEVALARLATGGDLVQRIAQLEQKAVQTAARNTPAPRRSTAIEAYADGVRSELRTRAAAAAERARADLERCDRAAALAVDAALLGAPQDGTSQRLRDASAQVAARRTALTRLAEEVEFYAGPDLLVASQLLSRLEEPVARDPAPSLEPAAQAIVRAAKDDEGGVRASWLQRAAALCGWHLITPAAGDAVQPEWHQPVDSGGETVVALACPGLRRVDGTLIVEARVKVDPGPGPRLVAPAPSAAVEALATAIAAAPPPCPAVPVAAPVASALPEAPPAPFALLPAHVTPMLALADLAGETAILPEEAAAASVAAASALRIVAGDPAMNDEALATQVALSVSRSPESERAHDLVDARTDEIHALLDPLARLNRGN